MTRVSVDSSISDLAAFAIAKGSTYKILKTLNPWLLKSSLTNDAKKTYTILFPAKGTSLYGLEDEVVPGSAESTQTDTSKYVTVADITTDSASRSIVYNVTEGDSWITIAEKFGVDKNYLLEFNKRDESNAPKSGEEIVIPRR